MTDTQTDRHTMTAHNTLSIASHAKNVSYDVTMPLSWTVCRPSAGISYNQPVHQIWCLCLITTKIWKATKNAKIGVVWGLGVTQDHQKNHHLIERIWLSVRLQQKLCVYLVQFSSY